MLILTPSLEVRDDLVFLAAGVEGTEGEGWVVCTAVTGHGRAAIAWYRSGEGLDAKRWRAYLNAVRLGFRLVPGDSGVGLVCDAPWLTGELSAVIDAVGTGDIPASTDDGWGQLAGLIHARGAAIIDTPERRPDSLGCHSGVRQARALAIAGRMLLCDGDDPERYPDLFTVIAERRARSLQQLRKAYQHWRTQRRVAPRVTQAGPEVVATTRLRLPLAGKPTVVACAFGSNGGDASVGACAAVSGDGTALLSWWHPDIGQQRARLWAARLGLRLAAEKQARALIVDDGDARVIGELKALRTGWTEDTPRMRHPCDPDVTAEIAELLAARRVDIHPRDKQVRLLRAAFGTAWSARRMAGDGADPGDHKAAIAELALVPMRQRGEPRDAYPSWEAAYAAWRGSEPASSRPVPGPA